MLNTVVFIILEMFVLEFKWTKTNQNYLVLHNLFYQLKMNKNLFCSAIG